jgi:peptide/nickel transport system permease protein
VSTDLAETPADAAAVAPPAPKKPFKLPRFGWILGSLWLGTLSFCALFAYQLPFIRAYNTKVKVGGRSKSYGWGPGWNAWLGTDKSSYDVFARCIYGARVTLLVGLGATAMGLFLGGIFGILGGYYRGWVDRVTSIIVDCLLALPPLLLALLLIYRLDALAIRIGFWKITRPWEITITLGILAIAPLARIVRAQTISLREREFVLAARSLGAKNGRIILREVLPNVVPTMLTVAFTGLGILIAAEGALAFLGLGVERPQTWGKMINAGRDDLANAWWATIFPCLFLLLSVVSFNLIGDQMARRFDIREAAI